MKKKECPRRSTRMGFEEKACQRRSTESVFEKKACQRRSTRGGLEGTDQGQITLLSGLFLSLFVAVLLTSHLQMEMVRSSARYVEDALAASGLACALVDLREYGTSHVLKIADEERSYEQFQSSLRTNLGLDENWECGNKRLISGKVTLESFVLYNFANGQVECCKITGGRMERSVGSLGQVRAPNGQIVEHTGVYGEISYELKGIWGLIVPARKGKLVDIVGEET